jgi:hypothetical protein
MLTAATDRLFRRRWSGAADLVARGADEAELVALGIGHDLERSLLVRYEDAEPGRPKRLGLGSGRRDVVDLKIEMEPVLDGLRLRHRLERKASNTGYDDVRPVVRAVDHLAPDQGGPEAYEGSGINSVQDDLFEASAHVADRTTPN